REEKIKKRKVNPKFHGQGSSEEHLLVPESSHHRWLSPSAYRQLISTRSYRVKTNQSIAQSINPLHPTENFLAPHPYQNCTTKLTKAPQPQRKRKEEEKKPMSTSVQEESLTALCPLCHSRPPKYRCPACATRTCSVACVKKHKLYAQCSGRIDATAFVRRRALLS